MSQMRDCLFSDGISCISIMTNAFTMSHSPNDRIMTYNEPQKQ